MRILNILGLFVLILIFSLNVKTQSCGPSITKIFVLDNQGNIIENVMFEFSNTDENTEYLKRRWLMFEKDVYELHFALDLPSPKGNQLLKISAVGFEAVEQTIYFRQPQYQIFSLTLKRKGSNEQSYFEELLPLEGSIRDKNEEDIAGIKVILTDIQGKKYETLTSESGHYEIPVREGIYDVEIVGAKGLASAKYEKFEITKKQYYLDAVLEIDSKDYPLVTELVCEPNQFSSSLTNCVLITNNPSKEN